MARKFTVGGPQPSNTQEKETVTSEEKEISGVNDKKKSKILPIAIISAVLLLLISGIGAFFVFHGGTDYEEANNGAMLIGVDEGMTDDEINQMLAEQATSMKIHVWQAPAINGDVLSLGFENSASNKYDQAFRVIQNGETIYESYPVAPGDSVKDVECPKARVGQAIVEIFNVVDGSVYGNGVRCEVVIIGTDNAGNKADRVEDVTGVLTDTEAETSVTDATAEDSAE